MLPDDPPYVSVDVSVTVLCASRTRLAARHMFVSVEDYAAGLLQSGEFRSPRFQLRDRPSDRFDLLLPGYLMRGDTMAGRPALEEGGLASILENAPHLGSGEDGDAGRGFTAAWQDMLRLALAVVHQRMGVARGRLVDVRPPEAATRRSCGETRSGADQAKIVGDAYDTRERAFYSAADTAGRLK